MTKLCVKTTEIYQIFKIQYYYNGWIDKKSRKHFFSENNQWNRWWSLLMYQLGSFTYFLFHFTCCFFAFVMRFGFLKQLSIKNVSKCSIIEYLLCKIFKIKEKRNYSKVFWRFSNIKKQKEYQCNISLSFPVFLRLSCPSEKYIYWQTKNSFKI